jgi:pyruvate dehydrogenase E2 component (dihydrolipoamide acetyltransferase)
MTEGKIAKWTKREGDELKSGDVIAEIETDKATMDFQFQDEGYLAKILIPEGSDAIKIGTAVAIIVDDLKDIAAAQAGASSATASSAAPKSPAASVAPAVSAHAPTTATAPSSASIQLADWEVTPSARSIIATLSLDASALIGKGTGKGNRVTKGDVLEFAATGKVPEPVSHSATSHPVAVSSAPTPAPTMTSASPSKSAAAPALAPRGTYKDSKPSTVRKVIAQRLAESKAGIPHQYATMECILDNLMKLRSQMKEIGVNLSVNDMIVKACAKALKDVPEANCFYDPSSKTVKANKSIDISVAVATDGGLITPIVKNASSISLSEINGQIKDLATRARAGKLKPEEFQGGSFTISNLGMFGIDEFTAVINPPQACIMAVGKGESKVVYPRVESIDKASLADAVEPKIVNVMTVSLSSDARVVDDSIAAQYLQVFRHYIENPMLLVA